MSKKIRKINPDVLAICVLSCDRQTSYFLPRHDLVLYIPYECPISETIYAPAMPYEIFIWTDRNISSFYFAYSPPIHNLTRSPMAYIAMFVDMSSQLCCVNSLRLTIHTQSVDVCSACMLALVRPNRKLIELSYCHRTIRVGAAHPHSYAHSSRYCVICCAQVPIHYTHTPQENNHWQCFSQATIPGIKKVI